MNDITVLYTEFKSETEKKQFLVSQHKTINELAKKNAQLEEEIKHLKELLTSTSPLIGNPVEKIILTPEQALIDSQIDMIRDRSYGQELSLEDVKKLDILLRGKKLVKEESKTIETKSTIKYNSQELLELAKNT